jgi:hypothetical protein
MRINPYIAVAVMAAAVGFTSPPAANASLIGDMVSCNTSGLHGASGAGNILCDANSAPVVTPGTEFDLLWFGSQQWSVNIEAFSIELVAGDGFQWGGGPNEGVLDLTDLNFSGGETIQSIQVTHSGIENFNPSLTTFSDHSVSIDLSGELVDARVLWNAGSKLTIDLTVSSSVPEPPALALLGLGLLGAGFARKRQTH